jgi:hypothetical protein
MNIEERHGLVTVFIKQCRSHIVPIGIVELKAASQIKVVKSKNPQRNRSASFGILILARNTSVLERPIFKITRPLNFVYINLFNVTTRCMVKE